MVHLRNRTPGQQGAGGRFRIGFAANGGHDGDSGDARFINGAGVPFVDAADRDRGDRCVLKKRTKSVESHDGGRVLFGSSRENGADPDVIRRGRKARQFTYIRDRLSHECVGTDDEPAIFG